MKKEEVYVIIDTEKKAKKVAKVLAMFNESVFTDPDHLNVYHNGSDGHWAFGLSDGSWMGKNLYGQDNISINHTEVTVSELKQIIAMDLLKKGDVVVCDLGNEKWIVEFSHFSWPQLVGSKWNYKGETHVSVRGGYFDKFIRYATEEEKQLLNPSVKEDEKHTGSFESLRKCDSVDFPNDFKEVENPIKDPIKGVWRFVKKQEGNNLHEVDALVFDNGNYQSFGFDHLDRFINNYFVKFNSKSFKRNATQEEVAERFFKECYKLYPNKIGFIFNHSTNEITACGEIIFKNGTWLEAKKIEIDPFKELKEGHKKGIEIEYKSSSGIWKTSSNPAWRKTGNYRIRPVKIGDWFFTTHDQTNVKYYYQVNETNINSVGPNHVRILNQMVIDILNNGKYTV